MYLRDQVVRSVVRHCVPEGLVSIALVACSFMEEVDLMAVSAESPHYATYKDAAVVEERIHIPGAAYLTVQFDPRYVVTFCRIFAFVL